MEKMDNKLNKAREYEKENACRADNYRPDFHVTGGIGWINDPNGFSVYKGEYHLFHQYHPYDTEWGPMHWGHLKTRDFIKWDRLPVALAPDASFDKDGCFSGNACETPDGKQLIIYTGVVKEFDEAGHMLSETQHQCVAVGDGVDYEKYDGNPVISVDTLPEGASHSDFRDPKIWREGDSYYCLAANRGKDGFGALRMYKSKDALHWSFVKTFAECKGRYGTMWECPDFFSLKDMHVLVISPMEMEAESPEFHSGHGVIAICGDYNADTKDFADKWVQSVDYGIDFYAPQTLIAPDGRRIMTGWMRNWATKDMRRGKAPIFGAMTLPRELTVKNNRIYINPVREIENYRVNPVHIEKAYVKESAAFEGICGRTLDMTVEVDEGDYSFFKIKLCKGAGHEADLIYRPKEGTVTIDRTYASGRMDTVQQRNFPVDYHDGAAKFRVIMDKDSIELFVNDGERVATFITYNDLNEDSIEFEADREVGITIDKYDIKVD